MGDIFERRPAPVSIDTGIIFAHAVIGPPLGIFDDPESVRQIVAVEIIFDGVDVEERSEEHTSELQSLMRISYAVFCLKKKKRNRKFSDHKAKIYMKLTQSAAHQRISKKLTRKMDQKHIKVTTANDT